MLGGHGPGIPTPKRLDSCVVHNTYTAPVKVVVSYDNHKDGTLITEEREVGVGQHVEFAEKVLDMGSWQAVAPVKTIYVSTPQGLEYTHAPEVSGIVKKLNVSVVSSGSSLKLQQGAAE